MEVLRAQDVSQGGLCIILTIMMMINLNLMTMMMMMVTCAKRRVDEWQSSTFATLTVAFETLFNSLIIMIIMIGCYGDIFNDNTNDIVF